jgi:hypothetical protein
VEDREGEPSPGREVPRPRRTGVVVRGGVTFVLDPSVRGGPSLPDYEWIDDRTVRIHPESLGVLLANLAS